MILEIFYPIIVLILFSILDLKKGGVQQIFLLSFVGISLLINIFIIQTSWIHMGVSLFIGSYMVVINNWGVADSYVLFGLTTFLHEYYYIFLWTLVFIQLMMYVLTSIIQYISNKKDLKLPYIPFISLGFLYVLPKLIVYNMG